MGNQKSACCCRHVVVIYRSNKEQIGNSEKFVSAPYRQCGWYIQVPFMAGLTMYIVIDKENGMICIRSVKLHLSLELVSGFCHAVLFQTHL